MDGSGYPHGLAAEAIPIEARIVAVADTYDALTSGRSYRRGCDPSAATCILLEEAGTHLDLNVVNALLRSIGAQIPIAGAGRDRLETAIAV
jgi:putative two-component system response regulator